MFLLFLEKGMATYSSVLTWRIPWTTASQVPLSMGIHQARILTGVDCHSLVQVIEPRSPSLHADSLLSEPTGKPKNTGVGSLFLLQGNFPTQELKRVLLQCRQILYQLSIREALC